MTRCLPRGRSRRTAACSRRPATKATRSACCRARRFSGASGSPSASSSARPWRIRAASLAAVAAASSRVAFSIGSRRSAAACRISRCSAAASCGPNELHRDHSFCVIASWAPSPVRLSLMAAVVLGESRGRPVTGWRPPSRVTQAFERATATALPRGPCRPVPPPPAARSPSARRVCRTRTNLHPEPWTRHGGAQHTAGPEKDHPCPS